jgi:acid phosphatase
MLSSAIFLLLAAANLAAGASTTFAKPTPEATFEPSLSQIAATAATATPLSPQSNVTGVAFDRLIQVWLENTVSLKSSELPDISVFVVLTFPQDYSAASGNADQKWLASQGITLTNYYATTHPSEPNYCAVVSGDNFGMDNDDFHSIPANISTVVDLLDTKGISWAEYQEAMPYPGFQGFNFSNQRTFANDYVRKHDPLILFQSVTNNDTRLKLIKNFAEFDKDLSQKQLPQWAFITPNMTNDGHDTNVTFSSAWERRVVGPLLNNSYIMENTLVILTFDETETYTTGNKVFTILLGGAIPDHLKGTTDDTFYNHYSAISTVSMNWGLPSLGRWDCNANVFELVANKTGYVNSKVDTSSLFFNSTYPGPLSDNKFVPVWPAPNTNATCASGKGVLSSVVNTWGKEKETYNYTNVYPYDTQSGLNTHGSATKENSTSTNTSTSSSASASSAKKSGAGTNVASGLLAAVVAGFVALT